MLERSCREKNQVSNAYAYTLHTNRRGKGVEPSLSEKGEITYSCLENTLIAPVGLCGLSHLILRRFRVHDAVLSRNLLSVARLVIALNALVLVELGLEKGLERLELGLLGGARGVCCLEQVALKALDAVLDGGVADLRLRNVVLQLLVRILVSSAERALVQLSNEVNVAGQGLDVVAQALHAAEEVLLRQDRRPGALLLGVAIAGGALVVVVLQLIVVAGVVRRSVVAGIGGIWVQLPGAIFVSIPGSMLFTRITTALAETIRFCLPDHSRRRRSQTPG